MLDAYNIWPRLSVLISRWRLFPSACVIQEATQLERGSRCLVDVLEPVRSKVYATEISCDYDKHTVDVQDLEQVREPSARGGFTVIIVVCLHDIIHTTSPGIDDGMSRPRDFAI